MKKLLLTLTTILALSAAVQAQGPAIVTQELCWAVDANTDSSIVAYYLFSSREDEPRLINYLNAEGQAVTVATGSLTIGPCAAPGGGSVDPADFLYQAGSLSESYSSVTAGTHNVTAGAYRVEIYNDGLQNITVNGNTVPTGNTYILQAQPNPTNRVLDLVPALTIVVPSGGAASYSVLTPSN